MAGRHSRRGGGVTFSAAGRLLLVLILALMLQTPSVSARHWFWNDGLFPVATTGEGNAAGAAPLTATGVPFPTPAPTAPTPAAPTCNDAPVDPSIVSAASPGNPCSALAAELIRAAEKLGNKTGGKGFAAPSLFRACHSTFLFRKDCDAEDLLSIANAFDNLYVYKLISMDSPDQTNLPSRLDIVADLWKVVKDAVGGKYARLVDAHMAAFRATLALNDGHCMFMPECFVGSYDLPLPLMAVVENGQQIIRVAPCRFFRDGSTTVYLLGNSTAVVWIHQFFFSEAVMKVLQANKVDPEMYMVMEVTKALNTAAASVFLSTSSYSFPPPPTPLHLPLLLSTSPYSSPPPPSTSPLPSPSFLLLPPYASQIIIITYVRDNGGGSVAATLMSPHLSPHVPPVSPHVAPHVSPHVSPHVAPHVSPHVSPHASPYVSPHVSPHVSPYVSNASQIIIDVRGNGGGYTAAGYTAIRLLMGAAKVPDSDFALPVDGIIGTVYAEIAITALSIDPTTQYFIGLYANLNGTGFTSAFDYAPFRELRFTVAGPAGKYSAPFKLNKQFTGKQEQPVFGDRPFLVLNLAALVPQNASLPLNVKGAVGMALTNGYVDSKIPCEFVFLPSQHHINYTVDLIGKPWAMWSEVAKLFDSCAV
ncbi:unnamed protein product [Closterium sp. NIES-65]|nr:unnamed protein product [Closterium sp. NIES-65]